MFNKIADDKSITEISGISGILLIDTGKVFILCIFYFVNGIPMDRTI